MKYKDIHTQFYKKQYDIIKSWHNLSIREQYPYVKFFSNWISFNTACYALFYKDAIRERVDFDDIRKLPNIKSRLEIERSINLEEGHISSTEKNLKLKLKFPEKINLTIKERFSENYIYDEFSNKFGSEFTFDDLDPDLISLKNSLTKSNGRIYVIDMSRFDTQYNEGNDIDKMSSNGVISLLEDNSLSTIVKVLYQIRCNIFHGGKEPGDSDDDLIVKAANPILNRLVKFFIPNDIDENLNRIKDIIKYRSEIPKSEVLWGGANIIITYNNYSEYPKNHNEHYEYDIVIRTDYCKELSWLMYELGEIYLPKLGDNTRSIYHPVGEIINNSLKENKDIYSVFSDAMKKCEELIQEFN